MEKPFVAAVHVTDSLEDDEEQRAIVIKAGLTPGSDDPFSSYDDGRDGMSIWQGRGPVPDFDKNKYSRKYIPASIDDYDVVYEVWVPK